MKITKSQLERVIKEELEEALGEKTINLTGRIVKKKAGGGSKSARLMPVLVTNSGKEYPIFVIGDNPFSNSEAFAYLGKQVGVSGVMRGKILRIDPGKIVTTKDSMRTQVDSVDTGPTQAIEDGDPTQVELDADNDKKYGKTRASDGGLPFDLETSQDLAVPRTQALDADEADFNNLVDDANARINQNRTRVKRTSAMDRFRDLTGSMTSRFRGRGSRRRREESITKNELLKMIREELAKLK